ncbi:MAG: phosphatidylglycerol lysyltransferase domain-containing protein [Oscillospiraceae bacterium]|jgi:hypothetical protein|nr:phosphatidylglycerol lysyltransferase domain-containing protein [Oscillospiraceae bacterium]
MKTSADASVVTQTLPGAEPGNPLGFCPPQPEDMQWAEPLLFAAGRQGCEFCFGNIYAWAEKYDTEIARVEGFFLARSVSWMNGAPARVVYCFPIGPGDLRRVLPLLREDAARHGFPLTLYGLTFADIARLEEVYPGTFRFEAERDDADYIYRQADLSALAGKKYHQKRNHITRFVRNNRWEYEEITPAVAAECLKMARGWEDINSAKDPDGLRAEQRALERCFANYEAFGFKGALLRAAGKIVAFTMGEPLSDGMFCTHFEKAFTDEVGTYQMMNQLFAAQTLGAYEFINREEDLGDEGLRRAKLSYYPAYLLEKYTATDIAD